jgi:hypothetical protein
MKRGLLKTLLIFIIIMMILSVSGCSLFGKPKATAEPTLPPAPAVQPTLPPPPPAPVEPTIPPMPSPEPPKPIPTNPPEPQAPAPTEPAQAPAAPQQPAASGSEFFKEVFDSEPQGWSYKWVTGNTQERAEIKFGGGALAVTIPPREESAVKFFKDGVTYDDVVVVGTFRNLGDTKNGYSLLCRANDRGFYEFRVSSGGAYGIYRYEYALKEQGINPYVFIADGATNLIRAGVDKENTIEMDCVGKEFAFYINGKLLKTTIPMTLREQYLKYKSGQVGLGVMSFNETLGNVVINVNQFETMAGHQQQ